MVKVGDWDEVGGGGWVRGVVFWCGWVCVMPSTYNRIEMHEIEEMFLVLNIYKIY